jgi:hypothetical protein
VRTRLHPAVCQRMKSCTSAFHSSFSSVTRARNHVGLHVRTNSIAADAAMKTVTVDLGHRTYPIYIGSGLLAHTKLLSDHIRGKRVLIVTNETIAPLYLDRCDPGGRKLLPRSAAPELNPSITYKNCNDARENTASGLPNPFQTSCKWTRSCSRTESSSRAWMRSRRCGTRPSRLD